MWTKVQCHVSFMAKGVVLQFAVGQDSSANG